MSLRRLAYGDYTMAWICISSDEHLAATAMLDETHEALPVFPADTDFNHYNFGSIGGTNIVVAKPPAWEMASPSASAVTKRIVATFSNVGAVLLVGIGSGVPSSDNDIRLGDVVVSAETMAHDISICDTAVKSSDHGFRVPQRGPNSWSTILTRMISELMLRHQRYGNNIQHHLSTCMMHHPDLWPQFARPESSPDVLHEPVRSTSGWVRIERPARPLQEVIRVHNGPIATGNSVIRTGDLRDSVSKSLGGVLCFDTVPADLMHELPCASIRGICNYTDIHANRKWRGHAAAVAAAFAKEVVLALYTTMANRQNATLQQGVSAAGSDMDATAVTIRKNQNHDTRSHWLVPFPRNNRFCGREQELSTLQQWSSTEGSCRHLAIAGLGGVGKSQVALEFAYRAKACNPSCSVFWVPGTDLSAFGRACLDICHMLQIPGYDADEADVRKLVGYTLSNDSTLGPWLLVVDNIDDMNVMVSDHETGAPALMDYLPWSPDGTILFTTRNRKLALKHAGNNTILLDMMSRRDAETLLRKSVLQQHVLLDGAATKQLLESLDFLPLAIKQAVAYINENAISISEYTDLIRRSEREGFGILTEGFEDEGTYKPTKKSIATTWLTSIRQIRRTNPLAIEYLSYMACLCDQKIPQNLLPAPPSMKESQDAIGALMAYFLIKKRDARDSFDMHPLVRLATRNWLKSEGKLCNWQIRAFYFMGKILSEAIDARSFTRDWVMVVCSHAQCLLKTTKFGKRDLTEAILVAKQLSICLDSVGNFQACHEINRHLLRLQMKHCGPVSYGVYKTRQTMEKTLMELRDFVQVEDQLREMIKMGTELLKNHEDAAVSVCKSRLAKVVGSNNRFGEAKQIHEDNVALQIRLTHAEHPSVLMAKSALAETLFEHRHLVEAELLSTQLLDIGARRRGETDAIMASTMRILGGVEWQMKKLNEAKAFLTMALDMQVKLHGEDHRETLATKAFLVDVLFEDGNHEESQKLLHQVIVSRLRTLGPNAWDSIAVLRALAKLRMFQGCVHQAVTIHQHIVSRVVDGLGPGHRETLKQMCVLADVLSKCDREADAREILEKVLELRIKVQGIGHPDTDTLFRQLTQLRQADMKA
ncbi:hypothetical protein E4U54_001574 [Claviceps lovelessii]|nr:hypothetical protein E4U54_001574 [Claviceps lovelessii]